MTTEHDTDAALAEGRRLLRRRELDDAIACFEQVLSENEYQIAAHEGIATAAFLKKDYQLAEKHFKRVNAIDPRRADAYINLGAVYNRKNDYKAAVQALQKGITKNRSCAEAYYNLGLAYRGMKQTSLAISAYREAVRLDPKMGEAYQNLGNVYLDMGNTAQAISSYKRALEIDPSLARAKRGLAAAESKAGEKRDETSPFGRLVGEPETRNVMDIKAARKLTDEERLKDRQLLKKLAADLERATVAAINELKTDTQPTCHAVIASLASASRGRTTKGEALEQLQESCGQLANVLALLERSMKEMCEHENRLRPPLP